MIHLEHEFVEIISKYGADGETRGEPSRCCGYMNRSTMTTSHGSVSMGVQCGLPRANESVQHRGERSD